MKRLICSIILLSFSAMSQEMDTKLSLDFSSKGGGNGQLVVTPKGHTKPVPYEGVRAFETGTYRNFDRLPQVNGNVESRKKFNKAYAAHAIEWLDLIKKLSKTLSNDLIQAGEKTTFRIVNEYIKWEHKPYPDGELDYKKFEKAAFYNGEIIFSTPVMDKVGPLSDLLSKDQNQGFIVVHELINAAYPDLSVAQKLDIGEAIIRAKAFGDDKYEFNYNLFSVNSRFFENIGTIENTLKLLNDVSGSNHQEGSTAECIKQTTEALTNYDQKLSILDNFARIEQNNHRISIATDCSEIESIETNASKSLHQYRSQKSIKFNHYVLSMKKFMPNILDKPIDFESVLEYVLATKTSLHVFEQSLLKGMSLDIISKDQKKTLHKQISIYQGEKRSELLQMFLEKNLPGELQNLKLTSLIRRYTYMTGIVDSFYDEEWAIRESINDSLPLSNRESGVHIPNFEFRKTKEQLGSDYEMMRRLVKNIIEAELFQRNIGFNSEKTEQYHQWRIAPSKGTFPLQKNDFLFESGMYSSNVAKFRISKIKKGMKWVLVEEVTAADRESTYQGTSISKELSNVIIINH